MRAEKIGRSLGILAGLGIIGAAIYAWFYYDMTLSILISWLVKATGWVLIGSILFAIAAVAVVFLAMWILPYLWPAPVAICIYCLVNEHYIAGILAGIVACWFFSMSFGGEQ